MLCMLAYNEGYPAKMGISQ